MASSTVNIIERPGTTLYRWISAFVPVTYDIQRKDFTFNTITDNGSGKIKITKTGTNATSEFDVGEILYLKSDNGVYDLRVEVASRTFTGGNTEIVTVESFISSATTGFLNFDKRLNFSYYTSVHRRDTNALIATLKHAPDPKGFVTIDVSAALTPLLTSDNEFDFLAEQEIDPQVSLGFYCKFIDDWTGASGQPTVDDVSNYFFGVRSYPKIPSFDWGPSMGAHTPTIVGSFPVRADFLTSHSDMVLFRDRKFLLEMIHGELITDKIGLLIKQRDVNGTLLSTSAIMTTGSPESVRRFNIDEDFSSSVKSIDVDAWLVKSSYEDLPIGSLELIANNTKKVGQTFRATGAGRAICTVWISNQTVTDDVIITAKLCAQATGLPDETNVHQTITQRIPKRSRYVTFYFDTYAVSNAEDLAVVFQVTTGTSPSVQFRKTSSDSYANGAQCVNTAGTWSANSNELAGAFGVLDSTQLTGQIINTQSIEVRDLCMNPVSLMWKNRTGGDSQFTFTHSQDEGNEFNAGQKFPVMSLFANTLSRSQRDAIDEMMTVGDVYRNNIVKFSTSTNKSHTRKGQQVYIIDESGNKTGVIVVPGTNIWRTRDTTHRIQIDIQLPETITE